MRRVGNDTPSNENMLSLTPKPIFTGSWDHRPIISSPLSSSPIRASSPLSPIDDNARSSQRLTQSSPIQPIKFKYASRPARPNPVLRRREDAQEQRRKTFLQNVRRKADDKAWQRRDIEGSFLRTNLIANIAHLSHDAPAFSEAEIEDAMNFQQEAAQSQTQTQPQSQPDDDMMEEVLREEDELEQMVATFEQQQQAPVSQHLAPTSILSDDDYDAIFAELISQEQFADNMQGPSDQMDILEDNADMMCV